MTIAAKIREALNHVAPGGLTLPQLSDKTEIDSKKLASNLGSFTQRGEVNAKPDGEGIVRYHLNRNYQRGGKAAKSKKKPGKKAKGKASRPFKRLVEKHAKPNGAGLSALTLANLLAAGALLRQAIEDGVEDLEGNLALRNAIANQQRAEELLAAAK